MKAPLKHNDKFHLEVIPREIHTNNITVIIRELHHKQSIQLH
jgi:hypothetical protein